jgi:hypothetical protein
MIWCYMNHELEGHGLKQLWPNFMELMLHLAGGTEENHKKVSWPVRSTLYRSQRYHKHLAVSKQTVSKLFSKGRVLWNSRKLQSRQLGIKSRYLGWCLRHSRGCRSRKQRKWWWRVCCTVQIIFNLQWSNTVLGYVSLLSQQHSASAQDNC